MGTCAELVPNKYFNNQWHLLSFFIPNILWSHLIFMTVLWNLFFFLKENPHRSECQGKWLYSWQRPLKWLAVGVAVHFEPHLSIPRVCIIGYVRSFCIPLILWWRNLCPRPVLELDLCFRSQAGSLTHPLVILMDLPRLPSGEAALVKLLSVKLLVKWQNWNWPSPASLHILLLPWCTRVWWHGEDFDHHLSCSQPWA